MEDVVPWYKICSELGYDKLREYTMQEQSENVNRTWLFVRNMDDVTVKFGLWDVIERF
jgi:hypothetical protein